MLIFLQVGMRRMSSICRASILGCVSEYRALMRLVYQHYPDLAELQDTMSEAAGRIESTMVIPSNFAVIVFGVILGLLIGAPILGFYKAPNAIGCW
jgi:hypothetical protein